MKLTSTIFYLFNTHSHICCQFIIFIIKNKREMCYCIFSKCTYFFICKSSWNPKCIRRSINKRFLFRSQHYSRFSYILKIVKLFFRKNFSSPLMEYVFFFLQLWMSLPLKTYLSDFHFKRQPVQNIFLYIHTRIYFDQF